MTVTSQVIDLVGRFQHNQDVYTRPDYKEARARVEFIDIFFESLGWDVRNVKGYAEQYMDVVQEDALTVTTPIVRRPLHPPRQPSQPPPHSYAVRLAADRLDCHHPGASARPA